MQDLICFCIILTAIAANLKRFGYDASAETTELLCVASAVFISKNWIQPSRYYRTAPNGLFVGCLAIPTVISAFQVHFGREGMSSAYLRLSICCTMLTLVEAIYGDGAWRLLSHRALSRAAACSAIAVATFCARFPHLGFVVPAATLTCHYVVHRALLRALPETFSLGEAALLSTATTLLFLDTAAMLGDGCLGPPPRALSCPPPCRLRLPCRRARPGSRRGVVGSGTSRGGSRRICLSLWQALPLSLCRFHMNLNIQNS